MSKLSILEERITGTDKKKEVKCDIPSCRVGLGRTERHGRNLCERCEHKAIMLGIL